MSHHQKRPAVDTQNKAPRYGSCHEGQGSGYYIKKRYSHSLLVPDSVGVGTSSVVKGSKTDYLGRHQAKNDGCSVSNHSFSTCLPELSTRKIIQNLSNLTMPATLPFMTASVARGHIEATLKRHGDFLESCYAPVGDKWVIVFWRGAVLVESNPQTDCGLISRVAQIWQQWLALPRFPLALGSVVTMMFEGDRYSLQSFISELGEEMYLKREVVRDYLPKQVTYWHTGSQSRVIVVTQESAPIAVFCIQLT